MTQYKWRLVARTDPRVPAYKTITITLRKVRLVRLIKGINFYLKFKIKMGKIELLDLIDVLINSGNGGLEQLISSHVEMSKIGRKIAEEVMDNQRRNEDSCSVNSPNPAPERSSLNTEVSFRYNDYRFRNF